MRGMVPPDPQTDVSQIRFAVVYLPGRSRKRFPAGCVEVMDSMDAVLAASDPANRRFAARVVGPSKSSEGQSLYYLVDWFETPD